MTTNELLKRTAVRLAGAFTLLFALLVVALVAILYLTIGADLAANIRQRVEDTSDALVAIDAEHGFNALTAVVANEAKSVRDFNSIFLLRGEDEAFKAGNVQNVEVFKGWGILDRAWLPLVASKGDPDDSFYAIWKPVSKGQLLVGWSDRQIREVRRILLHGLGWGLATTVLLAVGFATLLARRAQARIDGFAIALERVGQGDIRERVPLTGSMDDLDHVASQINATLDHLQNLIENVNQASSDIAHDLKKPIGRLRRGLESALHSAKDVRDFRKQVGESLQDLDSIVETFEALLRITQIEAGARKVRFKDIDFGSVVADVADIYEPVAEESGDVLECNVRSGSGPIVHGDRELLTQLFANLIENAIRHSPRGTHIGVELSMQGDRLVAVVRDTGPGIPAEEHKKVFRRLYRLEKSRTTPGSGLGLSLAAAIAELHGATIKLDDNQPGLRVIVSFPKA
jgi:signal transduction histidine kinase